MDGPEPQEQREVIDFVSRITDTARLRIEENLPHGFVRLKVAEAERRQAQHDIRSVEDVVTEMVRNSRDAGATTVLIAFLKEQGRFRKIVVLDDGCGIPADAHRLVFEPRVTSKRDDFEEDRYGVHGRGMALFSIRSRSVSADIVASEPSKGTAIAVAIDTRKVPERSDQATLPGIEQTEDGEVVGSGPHNVARVLLEMSIDHRRMDFFMGSFAEVLATARRLSMSAMDDCPWSSLREIDDARVLADAGRQMGLPVSERNAYRVMNGEIVPLDTVLDTARSAGGVERKRPRQSTVGQVRIARSRPLKRISKEDMAQIGRECEQVVGKVVGRYYLNTTGDPRVRRGRGKIMISFFITGEEDDDGL
jgi:hypothetical protein